MVNPRREAARSEGAGDVSATADGAFAQVKALALLSTAEDEAAARTRTLADCAQSNQGDLRVDDWSTASQQGRIAEVTPSSSWGRGSYGAPA